MHKAVLYAEDEPDDVFFMERAFRRAGIEHGLHTVADGKEAMDYLSGKEKYADRTINPLPAVVLLDLKMPEFSGFEVLRWIRSTAEVAAVPVVILTSSAQRADIERASSLGANGYLVKPGNLEELAEVARAIKAYWLEHDRFSALLR
jgi:CheY-like chemotaxis protein